jgi:hypothetical protein
MGYEDRNGGEHGAKSSGIVHGTLDQGSDRVVAVKCYNSQVSGMGSRDKGDPFSPNGPTKIRVCQHIRGSLRQMVRVQEYSSTQVKPFDDS